MVLNIKVFWYEIFFLLFSTSAKQEEDTDAKASTIARKSISFKDFVSSVVGPFWNLLAYNK